MQTIAPTISLDSHQNIRPMLWKKKRKISGQIAVFSTQ